MKDFFKKLVRSVALSIAVSSTSVITSTVLLATLAYGLWLYCREHLLGATKSVKGSGPRPPSAAPPVFQLHEAVVMRQLIMPADITTTWKNIGGCEDALRHIKEQVIYPLAYACTHQPEPLLMPPKGVLLHGPPGCGKTLIAKAIAKEVQANFLNIDVSIIKNMWVGETEKMAAAIFSVAYKIQPCIIFLDEVDTLLGTRNNFDGPANTGLKAIFLQMWDGLESDSTARIMVLGATNRLDSVDAAFLRRLPLQFEIDLPSKEGRLAILKIHLQQVPLADDVDLEMVVTKTEGFSGSDLQELCRCAAARRLVDYMEQLSARKDSTSCELRELTNDDLVFALDIHRLNGGEKSSLHFFYI